MLRLQCDTCVGREATLEEFSRYECRSCGNILSFQDISQADIKVDPSCGLPWRYPELLPIDYDSDVDDRVLPLISRAAVLESMLEVQEAWLIDCTGFGTGTFKDLEASVVISAMKQLGHRRLSLHSTGNTALAYQHYAKRAGVSCAVYIPNRNAYKLGTPVADHEQPVHLVDASYASLPSVAEHAAVAAGTRHLAPLGWKLEGKAALAYLIHEKLPSVDTLVQTVAGGYGPLAYEMGFQRLRRVTGRAYGVLARRRYLLFQTADADALTRAWQAGSSHLTERDLRLPAEPFEPTLQSTGGLATLRRMRSQLPADSRFVSVPPHTVDELRPTIDRIFAGAGVVLDFDREKSAYISMAGMLQSTLPPASRLAVILSGSRPFANPQ